MIFIIFKLISKRTIKMSMFDRYAYGFGLATMLSMQSLTGFRVPGWKTNKVKVAGTCAPGFEPVRDAYQRLSNTGYDS